MAEDQVADEPTTGETTEPTAAETTSQEASPPAEQAASGTTPPSQADIDRVVNERLKRQEQALLKELGYGSKKEAVEARKEREAKAEAEKTEAQKVAERLAEAERRALEAEARAQALEQRQALTEAFVRAGVPTDRVSAAIRLTDLPNEETIDYDALAKGVLEANGFLVDGQTTPSTRGATGRGGAAPPADRYRASLERHGFNVN